MPRADCIVQAQVHVGACNRTWNHLQRIENNDQEIGSLVNLHKEKRGSWLEVKTVQQTHRANLYGQSLKNAPKKSPDEGCGK